MSAVPPLDCEVAVIGAGPVGLGVTLALLRASVDVVAVDRDRGPSTYPKARVVGVRSMELLRRWGVAQEVRDLALGADWCHRIVVARSIAGAELGRVEQTPASAESACASSPERAALCTQDVLERVLTEAVWRRDPGAVAWRTEVSALAADEHGVRLELRTPDGVSRQLRARYVVCADGVRGLSCGPAVAGAGTRRVIARQVSVRVSIGLERWTVRRPAFVYYVVDRGVSAQLLVVDGRREWVVSALAHRGETRSDYPDARVRELLATVVGLPSDSPLIATCTVRDVRLWDLALRVADRFRCGRVLRAGDAAHEILPTGAMGLNLGLAEADALAWRLAAVLRGWAGEAILDGYHDERRAVAERTAAWTRANLNAVARLVGAAARYDDTAIDASCADLVGYIDHPGIDLGPLVQPGPTDATRLVDDGRPGSRAPHLDVGGRGSILDLYGGPPVLLVDEATAAPAAGGSRASAISGVPLKVVRLPGRTDRDATWWSRHGVARDGAVLIRPDGYVSWRAERTGERTVADLTRALCEMAGR